MALTPGTRLGAYEVTGSLGAGGMGEVYRAKDTKLGREVAIKTLPSALAQDPDRLARFEREAKLLAALNHAHIGAIYGLDEHAGTQFIAMELIEGQTLEHKLKDGPLPVEDALRIGQQIAEALEAAHDKGVVHRDLKPANIMLTSNGVVKVLDFGLAKAFSGNPNEASPAHSPALSAAMTQQGLILGTAGYMSPEQASGQATDQRADVWAFGVVLYEMLAGLPLFSGESVPHILADVLRTEPNWNRLPKNLNPRVKLLLGHCLKKKVRNRYHSMADVRVEIEEVLSDPQGLTTAAAAAPRGQRTWMPWAAFAVAMLGMIALAIPTVRHLRETPPPETRLEISTPTTDQPGMFALSPDGRLIVFVASGDGESRLWLRALGATAAQPLADTDGATWPFWSPDGRSVGFFAGGALKRLDLGGGAPQTLAPVTIGRGGTWNAEGVIVFAPSATTSLLRVSATGGAVSTVTTLDPQQQIGQQTPFFLPDGRHILFEALGGPDVQGIYLGSLDGSAPTRLTPDDGQAVYLAAGPRDASGEGGWLLWGRASTLVAQRLDLERRTLVGDPVPLANEVRGWSVAAPGLVAYRTGADRQRQLTWVDRSGTARGTLGEPDGSLQHPRVSPDGRRVVVKRTVQGNQDLWLLDGARTSRLTFEAALDDRGVWSPDGTRIVFRSARETAGNIYQMLANGAGRAERLIASDQNMAPTSWSRDGRFLLYLSNDPQTNADLWVVPMVGDPTPSVFLKTPFREAYGAFSPDGRWVAYHSNESGRNEIYVRPFVPPGTTGAPAVAGQWQISTAGGVHPVWSPDGKELYYLSPAGEMMAAPIAAVGDALEPGAPVVLFPTHIVGGGSDNQGGWQYDVAPDGRFLINMELDDAAAAPITLIQNWNPEAKQ